MSQGTKPNDISTKTVGYRKRDRNLMLGGALMLWVGVWLIDFVGGFLAGVHGSP